jgi:hypothetical protein
MSVEISTLISNNGVTREEVIAFLDKVLNDPSFSDTRK